jgi:hypothetical protein
VPRFQPSNAALAAEYDFGYGWVWLDKLLSGGTYDPGGGKVSGSAALPTSTDKAATASNVAKPATGSYKDRSSDYVYAWNALTEDISIVYSPKSGAKVTPVTKGSTYYAAIKSEIYAIGKPNIEASDVAALRASAAPTRTALAPVAADMPSVDLPALTTPFYKQVWFLPAVVGGGILLIGTLIIAFKK